MNLGVEDVAQRRKKKDRKSRRSNRKKRPEQVTEDTSTPQKQKAPLQINHRKIFQTQILKVEQRQIGLIIGSNGKNIRELYKHTHCDILLPKHKRKKDDFDTSVDYNYYYVYDSYSNTEKTNMYDNDDQKSPKNTEKDKDESEEDIDDPKRLVEVKLRGTPEEIRDAELEINFMIKHGRLMLDHERDGNVSVSHTNISENSEDNDNAIIAEDIRVPSKICGMLIGNRGVRVKELMEETGSEIWVDWDKEQHIEAGVSTVHLKGTQYCVDCAKFEIRRIQKLFEKKSEMFQFEIPSFASRDLFGEKGENLKRLQKQYNVSITVKNYRFDRRTLRVGDEEERIQRTCMVILIGEYDDQMACKKGIDRLVGFFVKCGQCKYLKKEDDGYEDGKSGNWFCQDCWDEFNGVKKEEPKRENNYGKAHLDMKPSGGGGGGGACYNCGKEGHFSRDCPSPQKKSVGKDHGYGGGGGGGGACYNCGQEGHFSRECPQKKTENRKGNQSYQEQGYKKQQRNETQGQGYDNKGGKSYPGLRKNKW